MVLWSEFERGGLIIATRFFDITIAFVQYLVFTHILLISWESTVHRTVIKIVLNPALCVNQETWLAIFITDSCIQTQLLHCVPHGARIAEQYWWQRKLISVELMLNATPSPSFPPPTISVSSQLEHYPEGTALLLLFSVKMVIPQHLIVSTCCSNVGDIVLHTNSRCNQHQEQQYSLHSHSFCCTSTPTQT